MARSRTNIDNVALSPNTVLHLGKHTFLQDITEAKTNNAVHVKHIIYEATMLYNKEKKVDLQITVWTTE